MPPPQPDHWRTRAAITIAGIGALLGLSDNEQEITAGRAHALLEEIGAGVLGPGSITDAMNGLPQPNTFLLGAAIGIMVAGEMMLAPPPWEVGGDLSDEERHTVATYKEYVDRLESREPVDWPPK